MSTQLATLLPIRDRRDRTMGFELSTAPQRESDTAAAADDNARAALGVVSTFLRLAARSLLVPVTPALVRDGSLTRFAPMDVVMLIATESLEDAATRRALERMMASGVRFALDGYPDGSALPPFLAGSIIALDARRSTPESLATRLRTLVDAGLRPLVRGVDDRATRLRVLSSGAALHSGGTLSRAAAVPMDDQAASSIVHAVGILARLADGRPPDASFDRYVEDDPRMSAAILKSVGSAAIGIRNPRSVTHAISVVGRDAILGTLAVATARLLGEIAQDAELPASTLRRVYFCEQLGAALDPAPHPRARVAAALLSMVEYAFAEPPAVLFDVHFRGLPPAIRDALVERRQSLGALVDLADAMDRGWWADLRERCSALSINPSVVADAYMHAWRRAREDLATRD